MPVTMRDVARHARVSVKTVSNVVNDFPNVRPETKARVLAAISELGYRMNFSARNLSLGRTGMITLVVPQMRLPYFAELTDEVIVAAAERGYTVLVERTGGDREQELEVLVSGRRRMTDGLLFSPLGLRPADAHRLEVEYPLVLLGERALHGSVHRVATGNAAGARAATEHLLELGRRRIAVIGSYDARGAGAGSLRTRGFTEALAAAGLEHDPRRTGQTLEWTRATGAEAMRRVLDSGAGVDAVFGLNDVLALGAMRVLYERGLEVPEDVAVVGFDDIEEGGFARPSLTTVQPGRTEIARTAVWLLVDRIVRGEPASVGGRELVVAPELVVRESTGGAGRAE